MALIAGRWPHRRSQQEPSTARTGSCERSLRFVGQHFGNRRLYGESGLDLAFVHRSGSLAFGTAGSGKSLRWVVLLPGGGGNLAGTASVTYDYLLSRAWDIRTHGLWADRSVGHARRSGHEIPDNIKTHRIMLFQRTQSNPMASFGIWFTHWPSF